MTYDKENHDDDPEIVFSGEGKEQLIIYLQKIEDPRHARGVRYRFADLLLMCIYAVLCGHSEGTEIEFYVELNFEYFKSLIDLKHVPSHDTFSRVMAFMDFKSFSGNLGEWLKWRFPVQRELVDEKEVLHVDGKATRAASKKSEGEKPAYQLDVMFEGESMGVATEKVGDKENEASVLPDFLRQFDLHDTIVTVDAMGCNQNVIGAIHDKGGNYVLPLKENQKNLLGCIVEKVAELEKTEKWRTFDRAEHINKEHGRIDQYSLTLIDDTSFIFEEFGLKSFYGSVARIGVLDKKVISVKEGKEIVEKSRRYLITDLESITADDLLKIKRAHWHIEMQHWTLDMQLREDQKTARRNNAVMNGGILRRFCLTVKNYDPEYGDKPMKRFLMANEHDIYRVERLLQDIAWQKSAKQKN